MSRLLDFPEDVAIWFLAPTAALFRWGMCCPVILLCSQHGLFVLPAWLLVEFQFKFPRKEKGSLMQMKHKPSRSEPGVTLEGVSRDRVSDSFKFLQVSAQRVTALRSKEGILGQVPLFLSLLQILRLELISVQI